MLLVGALVLVYVMLKPFMPYLEAKLGGKDILILIGKDNKIRLLPAKYSAGVYQVSKPPYSFLHKVPRAYRFGDLQSVFVHDSWGVTLDPDFAEVIEELKQQGVTDYEELRRRIEGKNEDGTPLPSDKKLKHSDIIRIHAFKDIDFGNFLSFVADMTPTEIRSHIDEYISKFVEDNKQLNPKKGGDSSGMIIMLMFFLLIGLGGAKMMGLF